MSQSRTNARFVVSALVAALSTFIFGSLAILGALLRFPRSWIHGCTQFWARWILNTAGITIQLEGLEHLPKHSAVLVGNHQGVFEILGLLAYLEPPPVFVTKQEAFKVPIFGRAMLAAGHIPVDRRDTEKAVANIREGARRLRVHGDHVVFFPEGTRTRDGQLKPFKKGAFVFALESGLPLVPFAVDGSYQGLPPGKRVVLPGVVKIRFFPLIETSQFSLEQREQLRDQTYEVIAAGVTQLRGTEPLPETSIIP